jgi:hypothetical protein
MKSGKREKRKEGTIEGRTLRASSADMLRSLVHSFSGMINEGLVDLPHGFFYFGRDSVSEPDRFGLNPENIGGTQLLPAQV